MDGDTARAERLAALKTKFAMGVCHVLRNPSELAPLARNGPSQRATLRCSWGRLMRAENEPSTTSQFERNSLSTVASRYPPVRRAKGLDDNPWRLAKLGSTSGSLAALTSRGVAGDSRSLLPSRPTSCHNQWAGTQLLFANWPPPIEQLWRAFSPSLARQ